MKESHKGFTIEYEQSEETSLYHWCVVGLDGHVYHCQANYSDYYDAWQASIQWINSYVRSLPDTKTTRIALKTQRTLKDAEESLEIIADGEYSKHYRRIAAEGMGDIEALLLNASESIKEAMKINELVIRVTKDFPAEDLQTAIQQHLSRSND